MNHQKRIVYLGFNSFKAHKRGVENVIHFQSNAWDFERVYYIHWGAKTKTYSTNNFICISIKHCWYWPLILNVVLFKLKKKTNFIIHSHNPLFSFFSIYKTTILTAHDGLYYLMSKKKSKYKFLFFLIEKLLYYRCSVVHFISIYTKNQSLFGKRKNFVIIPNTSHFEQNVTLINSRENSATIKKILIVRSIEERARFELLLDVADKMKELDYRFSVAGKGPLLEYYQNEIKIRQLKNIEMLGYVNDNDLLYLYRECDLVLMIAEYGEGFGLPIIEGYLFNKPVIASNRCAIPEVIISKEFLFENEVDDIIGKLKNAINQNNIDFRNYYNVKFSNALVLSSFKKLYFSQFA